MKKEEKKVSRSKSNPITQRTVTKKIQSAPPEISMVNIGKVEILQREEGMQGTVTLEQKVVGQGVLRRRRVEVQAKPLPGTSIPAVVPQDPVSTVNSKPLDSSLKEAPSSPLSSVPRLRVVEASARAETKSEVKTEKVQPTQSKAQILTTKEIEEKGTVEEDLLKKDKLRKRPGPVRLQEPSRFTKRDLLGLVEEVEITRSVGRRAKKTPARGDKKTFITTPGASKRKIKIENEISVVDLAAHLSVKSADVISKLMVLGKSATLHQKLDFETAALVAQEYQYEVQNVAETFETVLQTSQEAEEKEKREERPPIVTVMGHVDHGKTTLLDFIRKTRVAQAEAGGITQHIGAYQIEHKGKKITFLDTPGHAAFTQMRARGAKATDIVILVVASDEGAKPQTLEALAHAKSASVPIIVALNKIDKPEARPDFVIQELARHELVPEEWGGHTLFSKISALTGQGIPELLELVLLQAEMLELKADPHRNAKGIVIESRIDKGKGPVATVIIQTGTLKAGNSIVCGATFGKVRALLNDRWQNILSAGPSTPVEVVGWDSSPEVGGILTAVSDETISRRAAELAKQTNASSAALSQPTLEDLYKKMKSGEKLELRIILKGDVQGSNEAIAESLQKIKSEKVLLQIVYKALGGISESDVDLAVASNSILFGFHVRPTSQAKEKALREGVQIKTYDIIYELMDDVKRAMQGLLAPMLKEHVLGQAEVRQLFNVSNIGMIAGCFVKTGKIIRNSYARLLRDQVVVYTARIVSLKRFKDDAREVLEGHECGIGLENYNDIKVGDVIECFENIEIPQAL